MGEARGISPIANDPSSGRRSVVGLTAEARPSPTGAPPVSPQRRRAAGSPVYGIGSMLTGPEGLRRAIVRAASASVGNGSASFFSPQAAVGNLRVSQTECPPGYETRITNIANLPASSWALPTTAGRPEAESSWSSASRSPNRSSLDRRPQPVAKTDPGCEVH